MINTKIDDVFERSDALNEKFDLFGQERDKPSFSMCNATDLPISGNIKEADTYHEYPKARRLKG
jgi:hypothetical protein